MDGKIKIDLKDTPEYQAWWSKIVNNGWDKLSWWGSDAQQIIHQRYTAAFNPSFDKLYAALESVAFEDVKCMFVGQDPYPNPMYATGLAFSVPSIVKVIPFSLRNIFNEYTFDLHYPFPSTGDLTPWTKEGILLWNAIPTCEAGKTNSHRYWPEWSGDKSLTAEIFRKLSAKGVVFVLMGAIPRQMGSNYIDYDESWVIETAHPSPRAALKTNRPFLGSRVFTRVNGYLKDLAEEQVNWRLP